MGAVTLLAARLRSALGDETPESAKLFAMETLTATSLDVIHDARSRPRRWPAARTRTPWIMARRRRRSTAASAPPTA
jgi:hypothetical protein